MAVRYRNARVEDAAMLDELAGIRVDELEMRLDL